MTLRNFLLHCAGDGLKYSLKWRNPLGLAGEVGDKFGTQVVYLAEKSALNIAAVLHFRNCGDTYKSKKGDAV